MDVIGGEEGEGGLYLTRLIMKESLFDASDVKPWILPYFTAFLSRGGRLLYRETQ